MIVCVVHVCFFSGDGVCFVSGWNSLFITMEHEQLIQISCHGAVVFIVCLLSLLFPLPQEGLLMC